MAKRKGIVEKAWGKIAERLVRSVDEAPACAEVKKDVSESKIAFITTAGVHLKGDEPFNTDGDHTYRMIPGDSKEEELMITHTHYDHEHADKDLDVVFPLKLMQELAERGVIGSVAPRNYGLMGYIPQVNRLVSGTGPEMADALVEDGVDICLLSPG